MFFRVGGPGRRLRPPLNLGALRDNDENNWRLQRRTGWGPSSADIMSQPLSRFLTTRLRNDHASNHSIYYTIHVVCSHYINHSLTCMKNSRNLLTILYPIFVHRTTIRSLSFFYGGWLRSASSHSRIYILRASSSEPINPF